MRKGTIAETGKPLFSSHMIDLSEESLTENLETCAAYLKRMSAIDMHLEIELGVTGGEEDGVDNTDIDSSRLYTQPEEVAGGVQSFERDFPNFTIAAAFGNVHRCTSQATLSCGQASLTIVQKHIEATFNTGPSTRGVCVPWWQRQAWKEIREAIGYGTVKDEHRHRHAVGFLVWSARLRAREVWLFGSQISNRKGDDVPNKKHYDPRVWLRKGEEAFVARLTASLQGFECNRQSRRSDMAEHSPWRPFPSL